MISHGLPNIHFLQSNQGQKTTRAIPSVRNRGRNAVVNSGAMRITKNVERFSRLHYNACMLRYYQPCVKCL
jgi:hypothetical protein